MRSGRQYPVLLSKVASKRSVPFLRAESIKLLGGSQVWGQGGRAVIDLPLFSIDIARNSRRRDDFAGYIEKRHERSLMTRVVLRPSASGWILARAMRHRRATGND